MRLLSIIALISCLAFAIRAEESKPQTKADARAAAPKLKAPSNLKFNSTTGTTKVFAPAPVGQALTADGTGFKSIWAYVKGTNIDSTVAGSPAASGSVLMAEGSGKASWVVLPFSNLSGVISSSQLGSNLTLGGTTTGTFAGDGSGLTGITASLANGSVTSAKLASDLDLAGTTTGAFSGNLSGNATTATTAGSAVSFTGSLAGNVTGPQGATVVATVGGVTAVNVAGGANAANAATNLNTASTIVKRDASGNFSAGTITGNLTGNVTGTLTGNASGSAATFTGNLAGDVTGTQAATAIAAATVTGKPITGFVSGAGTVAATDSVLQAINKLNGNDALKAPLDSPIFTGNVGFGATPTKAKVEISGATGTGLAAGQIGYFDQDMPSTGYTNLPTAYGPTSLYASGAIATNILLAFSDERIKRVEGRSDAARDLATLLDIEVTNYTYIDTLGKGSGKQKKVIAQQVEKVYPQAVSRSLDVVPDIFQKAAVKDGWVTLVTNLKKGERVRIIGEKKEAVHEVLEVAEGKFRIDFAADGEKVFVYGREVNDFRAVDYQALSMLNVSATQQIKKEKDAEVKALQTENAELRARLAELEVRDKARDARLARIEKMMEEGPPRTIRTLAEKE